MLGNRTLTGEISPFLYANSVIYIVNLSVELLDSNGKFPLFLFAQLVIHIVYFDSRLLDSNRGNFHCSHLYKLSLGNKTQTGEIFPILACTFVNISGEFSP